METPKDPKTALTDVPPAALVDAITNLAETQRLIAENQPRRQKRAHEVVLDTPFWDGKSPRAELKRPFYQHGTPVRPELLTNDEIDLINRLRPGLYNKKKWRVEKHQDGVGLFYSNKTLQQRFEMAAMTGGKGLAGILERILLEREEQDLRLKATGSRYEEEPDDF